ncbi:WD40-like Beta Propeller Repeat [Spirosomataceae bacterium TFI 002]|nr:WD40-like Beta Propeller Repeat [Spirosomataceae bacterium TFI 002]
MIRHLIFFILSLVSSLTFAQEVLWANKVIEVSSEKTDPQYSPRNRGMQILGRPNVYPQTIVSYCAWQPSGSSFGEDYIHVSFEKAIVPKTVAIAETHNPGGIARIFGYTASKEEILLYQNSENRPKLSGRLWNVSVDAQGKKIVSIKLLINHMMAKGEKQIDAIAMSTESSIKADINLAADMPENLVKENLGTSINSRNGEVAPIITPDGKTLFFTRIGHPDNIHDKKNGANIAQDIWYSKMGTNGIWANAANIGSPINDDKDNAAATVSADGKNLYILNVYKNGNLSLGLSKTTFKNGKWSYPEEVKIDYFQALGTLNKETNENEIKIEFSISHDEKVLIMGLKRNESYGGKDLYVSFLKSDGNYSKPLNLGQSINSAEDEGSPFLSIDKNTLYFNSKGHAGYGSADIFVSKRLDSTWNNWSEPKNLGPSINSPFWDGYFTLPASGDFAYLSTKDNSIGEEDIFKLSLFNSIKPNPVALLRFKIKDEISNTYFGEKPKISVDIDSIDIESIVFDYDEETNEFSGFVPLGGKYTFSFVKDGYLEKSQVIDLSREKNYIEIDRVFSLTPMKAGQKMVLENVQFEQGKYEINESSYDELKKMIELMQKYQDMVVLLEGHTDNQGDFTLNVQLAKDRVNEVRKYMIEKGGINGKRIQTKSWGPMKPLSSNSTPEMREKNRRVEFTILKM